MDQPTNLHTLDELALGLAHAGWVVRLQPEPPSALGAGHVVVRGTAGGTGAGPYLVRPRVGHRIEVRMRRNVLLAQIGVAFGVEEVHALLRRDALNEPRTGQQDRPVRHIDDHRWPRSA